VTRDRKSIIIIGGSGFVGSSIAKSLLGRYNIAIVDQRPPNGFDGVFRQCDIRDRDSILGAVKGADLIINTAIVQLPVINANKRLGYEVNVVGIQNICEAVESTPSIKGLIHTSSWHVFGERDLRGVLDEHFGYRPDKTDERARLYALCKIAQEALVQIHSSMSEKSYNIIRLGTVLGEGMPRQTAASLFIERALNREPMTPFKHTQHRPMLYVDINDVTKAFRALAERVFREVAENKKPSYIVNLVSPNPVAILDLAHIIQRIIMRVTEGKLKPIIQVRDEGVKPQFSANDKKHFRADTTQARKIFGLEKTFAPEQTLERILLKMLRDTPRK
jgi:nucleoside-diphosphate-sugar epimerase